MKTYELVDLILDADMPTANVYANQSAPKPWLVKLVLIYIVRFRDDILTNRKLADITGISMSSVDRCIAALRIHGLVTADLWQNTLDSRGGSAGTVYTLNLPAIQALPRVARRATA